jgi:5'-nucleotidase
MKVSRSRFVLLLLILVFALPAAAQQSGGKLTVLLTNDDGFDAPGLQAMIDAFRPFAEVHVVAPAGEQSGKSHSITTTRDPIPAQARRQADGAVWYAVDAPPATCTRVALENLLPRRPDVVISGTNRGENLGIVVYYSGTLGGAREAAFLGIPAIAVSMRGDDVRDYAAAAAFTRQLVEQLHGSGMLRPGLFLNVNVPAGERKGVEVARLSMTPTLDRFEQRRSPRGRLYFWSAWRPLDDDEPGTDVHAFERGYITVTPMRLDVTDEAGMAPLRGLRVTADQ